MMVRETLMYFRFRMIRLVMQTKKTQKKTSGNKSILDNVTKLQITKRQKIVTNTV